MNTSLYARLGHPWPRTVPSRRIERCAGESVPTFCFFGRRMLHGVYCLCGRVDGRDRVRQGCRTRAYRDVFTACPVHQPVRTSTHQTQQHPSRKTVITKRKTSRCRIWKLGMNRFQRFLELVGNLHAKTVQVFLQLFGAGRTNDVAGHERTRGDVLQRQLRG